MLYSLRLHTSKEGLGLSNEVSFVSEFPVSLEMLDKNRQKSTTKNESESVPEYYFVTVISISLTHNKTRAQY